jgi:hypothetical protein
MPVLVMWEDEQRIEQKERGATRDVSTQGLFLYSPAPIEIGTRVDVEIQFPPLERPGRGSRLMGKGQVVRVERGGPKVGFAVRMDAGLHLPPPVEDA